MTIVISLPALLALAFSALMFLAATAFAWYINGDRFNERAGMVYVYFWFVPSGLVALLAVGIAGGPR